MVLAHIGSGLEHIDALQVLFRGRATPRAPWTLLRSVYEAGFWATWLLDSDDGATRRQRGLHAEVQGMKQRAAFYSTFFQYDPAGHKEATRDHAEHEKTYRRECQKLGIDWSVVNDKIQVLDALDKLSVVRSMDKPVRAAIVATWRSLSGMQHGHAYALMLSADIQPGTTKIPGGQQAIVTIKDGAFIASASAANVLLIEGMKLYVARSTRLYIPLV